MSTTFKLIVPAMFRTIIIDMVNRKKHQQIFTTAGAGDNSITVVIENLCFHLLTMPSLFLFYFFRVIFIPNSC